MVAVKVKKVGAAEVWNGQREKYAYTATLNAAPTGRNRDMAITSKHTSMRRVRRGSAKPRTDSSGLGGVSPCAQRSHFRTNAPLQPGVCVLRPPYANAPGNDTRTDKDQPRRPAGKP